MLDCELQGPIERLLEQTPAVVLLGPRQVGKTTLAKAIAARHPGAMVWISSASRTALCFSDPSSSSPHTEIAC